MSTRLPPSLLDGAWFRLSVNHGACKHSRVPARSIQSLARAPAQTTAGVDFYSESALVQPKRRKAASGSLAVRGPPEPLRNAMLELQKRVDELIAVSEEMVKEEEEADSVPEFTENDLLAFYEDVLTVAPTDILSSSSRGEAHALAQKDMATVDDLAKTLADQQLPPETTPSSLLSTLQARLSRSEASTSQPSREEPLPDLNLLPTYKQVVYRLKRIVPELARAHAKDVEIPVIVMTLTDWTSLVKTCMYHSDTDAAEQVLSLMRESGSADTAELMADVMTVYANKGDVYNTERMLQTHLTAAPTERQRDLHIKTHMRSCNIRDIPESALSVLHHYESKNLPAPQKSYNRIITHLFSITTSLATSQAWDLFVHMRYIAHPEPDAQLYTTMIKACGPAGEPERALDLFTEMTVDKHLPPTQAAYNAVIFACARAGSRAYVTQAFRLAREMLNAHRDARGVSPFRADRATYSALLEGAKRIGDLQRARWILAELVQEIQKGLAGNNPSSLRVSEEIMVHVFHAYSAYKPPFKRSMAPEVDGNAPQTSETGDREPISSNSSSSSSRSRIMPPMLSKDSPTFTSLPPQSHTEALHEARLLFERIIADRTVGYPQPFSTVELTPRLLNSYIGVYFSHGKLEEAIALFDSLYEDHGVQRTPRVLVDALERCTVTRRNGDKRKREREEARVFAEHVWRMWEEVERGDSWDLSPRYIERAHSAILQVYAISGDLDKAVEHLRAFVGRYPPASLREPSLLPDMFSRRTRLKDERPLIRLTSASELSDDTVPPFLSWPDLQVLHHRLKVADRHDEIRYVKWVCHAYRGSLKMRRDKFLKVGEEDWQERLRDKRLAIPYV